MVGMGGGGGSIHPHVLLMNGFLINCLHFENTKVCCYNKWLQLSDFMVWNPVATTK